MKTSSRSLGSDSKKESSPAGKRDRNRESILMLRKAFSVVLAFAVPIMIGCGSHTGTSSVSSATQAVGALTLSSVTPDSADVASPVTVQVTGAGFDNSSVIMLNGNTVPTTLVNSTTVTTSLSADAATAPTAVDVAVSNKASDLVSNALKFYWVRPLVITSTTLAPATQGSSYQVTLTATGGRPQYSWTAKSGLPTGLTMSSSGAISGTPSGSGNFSVNVAVSDSSYPVRTASVTLALQVASGSQTSPSLAISASSLPTATVNKAYSGMVAATGGTSPYTWSVASGSLPAGLSLAPATGVISGTPTASGTFNFSVSVSDSSPTVQKQSNATTITVAPAVAQLAISSSSLPNGTVAKSYSGTFSATGGTTPYTWSVSSGTLPAGLSLAPATGVISGTPTARGVFNFTISVSDSGGLKSSALATVTIAAANQPPVAKLSVTPTSGTAPVTVSASAAGSSDPNAGGSITSTSINFGDGTVVSATSGTHTYTTAGTYTVTATVNDNVGLSSSATNSVTVTASAPQQVTVTPASLQFGAVAVGAYSSYQEVFVTNQTNNTASIQTPTFTGDFYSESTSCPSSLPTGGSCSLVVRFHPTATGSRVGMLTVHDNMSGAPGITLAGTGTGTANVTITSTALPSGTSGTSYSATLAASGGVAPYAWSVAGVLPTGLALNAATGTLAGTPTQNGTFNISVSVADSETPPQVANESIGLVIQTGLAVTTSTLPIATVGLPYSATLTALGGQSPYTWSIASGTLPSQLSLNATTGVITGTPAAAGTFQITWKVTDSASSSTTATLSLQADTGFQYVLGNTNYPYSTLAEPAKNGSYIDSAYNTKVTRITNSETDASLWGMLTGYPTWSPSSYDQSYLIFMGCTANQSCGNYYLYNANTHAYVREIGHPGSLLWWNSNDPEPRWDRSGSNNTRIYYRRNMQLHAVDALTDADTVIHDFCNEFGPSGTLLQLGACATDAYQTWGPGTPGSPVYFMMSHEYGSPDETSRYWAWYIEHWSSNSGGDVVDAVVTYDRVLDKVISYKDMRSTPNGRTLKGVLMSPDGNYVEVNYDYYNDGAGCTTEFCGPHIYKRDFSSNVQNSTNIPHGNWAWDKQGNLVFVNILSSEDVVFTRADTGQVFKVDSGYNTPPLLDSTGGCTWAILHNYQRQPGWAFVNTYGDASCGSTWSYNQIWAYEIDEAKCLATGSSLTNYLNSPKACSAGATNRTWRVSFTQNYPGFPSNYYFSQSNAMMNYEGTKIWFTADWRDSSSAAYHDVFEVDLPASWASDLANLP